MKRESNLDKEAAEEGPDTELRETEGTAPTEAGMPEEGDSGPQGPGAERNP